MDKNSRLTQMPVTTGRIVKGSEPPNLQIKPAPDGHGGDANRHRQMLRAHEQGHCWPNCHLCKHEQAAALTAAGEPADLTDAQWREQITAFVDSRDQAGLTPESREVLIDLLTTQAVACAPVFFERDRLREAARRVASAYMAGGDIGQPLNDLCDAAGLLQQGDPPTNALPPSEGPA